ncbi:MAG: tripartite tricarboxylate transporter substrate binding protein [Rubritepida sp.]|nr:tripartite tricarboxylate transporter substrate binding protein [Rubritepida sp.]
MQRRNIWALGASLCAAPAVLRAQPAWPSRPVRVLVGFPPGQSSDISARLLAAEMEKTLGQPFVIENRPGAGATLAAAEAARGPTDGYTVLFTSTGPLAIAPHLYQRLGYDALTDFAPSTMVAKAPLILVVGASSPFRSVADLVAAGQGSRSLNYGSGGTGATAHLGTELFRMASGTNLTHVPYRGSSPALNDLVAGRIDFMFDSPAPLLPLIRDGQIRALASTGPEPYSELPEVPLIAATYPGFDVHSWTCFVFRAGTPEPIVERFHRAMTPIIGTPEMTERMIRTGVEPYLGLDPAAIKQLMATEFAKWQQVIRTANIRLE